MLFFLLSSQSSFLCFDALYSVINVLAFDRRRLTLICSIRGTLRPSNFIHARRPGIPPGRKRLAMLPYSLSVKL
jgi:hypothetical protein